jgi:NAD-dependent deacetylase
MIGDLFRNIVILTGAGISKESGIDTFRDEDGLWSRFDIDDVATPDGFRRNPKMVHDFHNMLRAGLGDYAPNPAHLALARLEREHDGQVLVVTQNVDDLHERAGSRNLIHMHGELYKARCEACGRVAEWRGDMSLESPCPACKRTGAMRPHVTWFYEMPMEMHRIYGALSTCDLFLSIGTSGNVYPAAGFVADVRRMGHAHTVELNLEPSEGVNQFAECIHGPASEVVPDYVEELLSAGAGETSTT